MTFTHLDAGTPETAWEAAGVTELPSLSADELGSGPVVLLLAHPDDEALGCPALLSHLGGQGREVTMMLFTAGENSHPQSPTHTPEQLAEIRLAEYEDVLTELDVALTSTVLHLGDGTLATQHDRILAEVDAVIAELPDPLTIIAPYHGDGHSDHETLGRVARTVGANRAATVLEFPIWYWHWAQPEDEAWREWAVLPDPEALDREALWQRYPSQTRPLSDAPGDEAILRPELLAHFVRGGDTFAVTRYGEAAAEEAVAEGAATNGARTNDATTAEAVFDDLHARRPDPWELQSSQYEIDKRAALIRALPDREYSHILEIGCSIGALSAALAERAQRVTAIDASAEAIATARENFPATPGLEFSRVTVPTQWPSGRFDAVVLAETGYYLSREQLRQTLRRIEATTTRDFTLVLCHFRGEIVNWPLDADAVHEQCLAYWPDARLVHHATAEYRLDVLEISADDSAPEPGSPGR